MLDWRKVKRLVIPEGVVRQITSGGVVLWGKFVSLGRVMLSLGYRAVAGMTRGRAEKANVRLQERLTERSEFDAVQPAAKRGRAWSWMRSRVRAVCDAAKRQGLRWTAGIRNLAKLVPKQPDAKTGRSSTSLRSRTLARHDTAAQNIIRMADGLRSRVRIIALRLANCVVAAEAWMASRNRLEAGNEAKLSRRLAIALGIRVKGADGQASLKKSGLLIPLKIVVVAGKAAAEKCAMALKSGMRSGARGADGKESTKKVAMSAFVWPRTTAASSGSKIRQRLEMALTERTRAAVSTMKVMAQSLKMTIRSAVKASSGGEKPHKAANRAVFRWITRIGRIDAVRTAVSLAQKLSGYVRINTGKGTRTAARGSVSSGAKAGVKVSGGGMASRIKDKLVSRINPVVPTPGAMQRKLKITLRLLSGISTGRTAKSSVFLESGIRFAVSFPGRISVYCGQRVSSALLLLQKMKAAGSPARVRQQIAVRERVLSGVGSIARAAQRNPIRLMIRIRATDGHAKKTGLREHMGLMSKPVLRFGGLPLFGKFRAAFGSMARASRGKIAVSGVWSGLVDLLSGSIGTGKMPEVLRARPSLRRQQYLARVSTERTVKNTGRGALPVEAFVGKLQNAAKAAMRGTKIPVRIALRAPHLHDAKEAMRGTKIPVRIALRAPHLQDGSIRQSIHRISGRIHGLLTAERSSIWKSDSSSSGIACGVMQSKTGQASRPMQRSEFFAAATMSVMTSPQDWEYPVQTGNCLKITQAYTVRQTDKKIIIN